MRITLVELAILKKAFIYIKYESRILRYGKKSANESKEKSEYYASSLHAQVSVPWPCATQTNLKGLISG